LLCQKLCAGIAYAGASSCNKYGLARQLHIHSSHSTLTLASLMTFAQVVRSDATTLLSASGVLPTTSVSWDTKYLLTSGSLSAATILRFKVLMIGCGVPAGAKMLHQGVMTKLSNPDSAMVLTSGRLGTRFSLVTTI